MAVTLTGSDGLFTRLGKLFYVAQVIETHQTTLDTEIEDFLDEMSKADLYMIGNLPALVEPIQTDAYGAFPILQAKATDLVIEMVHADDPLPSKDIVSALRRLIEQMTASTDDVDGNSTSIARTVGGSNTGNGEVVMDVKVYDFDNNAISLSQHVRAEDLVLKCTVDGQYSTGNAGREVFSVQGERAVTDRRNPNWPGGTGAGGTLRVVNPSEDGKTGAGRQILTNGDLSSYTTTNEPDNWTIITGSAGTDILEEASVVYRESKCLEYVGDGSTLVKIEQTLNSAGGTVGFLRSGRRYGISARVSVTSSVAAGDLKLSVKDSGNNVLEGGNAAVTVDLTATSDSGTFDHEYVTFTADLDIPSSYKFVIELTTAITSAESCYIADVCLFELNQYGGPAGPHINLVRGATDFILGDEFVVTVTQPGTGLFQHFFDRFFGMYELGIQLPPDLVGGESVADSLIA